jgi:hypothetical protein
VLHISTIALIQEPYYFKGTKGIKDHHINANIHNTEQLERENQNLVDLIVSSYEISSSEKTIISEKNTPWWNSHLGDLKKEVNKAWNNRHSFPEIYMEARRAYKKAIRRAFRDSSRDKCTSTEGMSPTAKLHKIISQR